MKTRYDMEGIDIAWCPGCGNFGILNILKAALDELEIDPEKLVVVSGIGQAAKSPQYMEAHMFNGLHGRALPVATAVKVQNPELTVIAQGGDGDMYGEGGNHFIHAVRRNPDLVNIVHNNMVYGLTKGQASPTSPRGMKTGVQTGGVRNEPFNPLAAAIALDASFVARTFSGDRAGAVEVFKEAILHPGYALIDVFQPCVTFNKTNDYKWFREHTRPLPEGHDPSDRGAAMAMALEEEPLYLGVFYKKRKATFEEAMEVREPAWKKRVDEEKLRAEMERFRYIPERNDR